LETRAQVGSGDRKIGVQVDHMSSSHLRHSAERHLHITLHPNALEDLEQGNRRHDQTVRVLNRRREVAGVGSVGEVLEPGRGVDDVHTRSPSLGTLVSIPRSEPRMDSTGSTGSLGMGVSLALSTVLSRLVYGIGSTDQIPPSETLAAV
jgi:hypothetical protein